MHYASSAAYDYDTDSGFYLNRLHARVRFKLMWRLDHAACLKSVAQYASHCRFARFSRKANM